MAKQVSVKRSIFDSAKKDPDVSPDERWEAVPALLVHRLVVLATRAGGAVLFGRSKDGGVPSLTIYSDKERQTFYFRPHEDVEENVRHWIEVLEEFTEAAQAS